MTGRSNVFLYVNFQRNQYRAPPAPLPNVERTLREILQPQRTTTNSCIRLPVEVNQFLMKSEMICLLPVYQGVDSENPYSFMRDFEEVCSAFLSTGSPLHIICMVLFPFSLKEKAKIWFHSLAPNSIFTWQDMRNEFLNKFFPPARTNALMRAIQNFSEKPGEPFAVVLERYKDLLHAIPHHGLDVGQICAYFHQGFVLVPSRSLFGLLGSLRICPSLPQGSITIDVVEGKLMLLSGDSGDPFEPYRLY